MDTRKPMPWLYNRCSLLVVCDHFDLLFQFYHTFHYHGDSHYIMLKLIIYIFRKDLSEHKHEILLSGTEETIADIRLSAAKLYT